MLYVLRFIANVEKLYKVEINSLRNVDDSTIIFDVFDDTCDDKYAISLGWILVDQYVVPSPLEYNV